MAAARRTRRRRLRDFRAARLRTMIDRPDPPNRCLGGHCAVDRVRAGAIVRPPHAAGDARPVRTRAAMPAAPREIPARTRTQGRQPPARATDLRFAIADSLRGPGSLVLGAVGAASGRHRAQSQHLDLGPHRGCRCALRFKIPAYDHLCAPLCPSMPADVPNPGRSTHPRPTKNPAIAGFAIGAPGFEPGTSPTRTVRATRLRHAPKTSPVSHSRHGPRTDAVRRGKPGRVRLLAQEVAGLLEPGLQRLGDAAERARAAAGRGRSRPGRRGRR